MNHLRFALYLCMALLTVLMACAPASATQSSPPVGNDTSSSSASQEPVNLAGPEMKVGSTFLYADGSLLVAVPAGPFTMGQGGADNPVHQVTLSDYWIFRTKVTNAQYAYCVSQEGCTPPNVSNNKGFLDPNQSQSPVTGVTYDQAAAYCSFVHGRLPTEAEWEKAARGPDGNIYPWGNSAPTCDLLNFDNCAGGTTPVNQYPAGQSYYSAFDMEGNTFEWTADRYQAEYYSQSPADDPTGPEKGTQRSVRSSAFNSGGNQTPAAMRFFSRPEDDRANLGFRCVVEDPTYFTPFCDYPATYGTDGIGGATAGDQPVVSCPDLSFAQQPSCQGLTPVTRVTVYHPPPGIFSKIIPPAGCAPLGQGINSNGFYHQLMCYPPGGTLSVCSPCTVTTVSQPLCPQGYDFDSSSKKCLPQPASSGQQGQQCLSGFTYGSIHGGLTSNTPSPTQSSGACCAYSPPPLTPTGDSGTDTASGCAYIPGTHIIACHVTPAPSCPAGSHFDGTECISTTIIYPYCKTTGVDLLSCQPEACTPMTVTACEQKCGGAANVDPANPCNCICNP